MKVVTLVSVSKRGKLKMFDIKEPNKDLIDNIINALCLCSAKRSRKEFSNLGALYGLKPIRWFETRKRYEKKVMNFMSCRNEKIREKDYE